MGSRWILLFMIALSFGMMFADARIMLIHEIPVMMHEDEMTIPEEKAPSDKLCSYCEQFAAQAVQYLSQNKTQQEIIDTLHVACSKLNPFEKQCVLLVDYYAPLFFLEVKNIDPEIFCEKVNLCESMTLLSMLGQEQACTVCQNTVAEILDKLKDPDTQLEIIQILLKACSQFENYTQQCKRLVFEYGPVILINAEKFLETTDICTALRVCKKNDVQMLEQAFLGKLHLIEM